MWFNPITLRMAKTLLSFGHSECNRINTMTEGVIMSSDLSSVHVHLGYWNQKGLIHVIVKGRLTYILILNTQIDILIHLLDEVL